MGAKLLHGVTIAVIGLLAMAGYRAQCEPSQLEEWESCQGDVCQSDCVMGQWTSWPQCSADCAQGSRQRWPQIVAQPINGGLACGPTDEPEPCNAGPCPVDCPTSQWSGWSQCSALCGPGSRQLLRSVLVQSAFGGQECGPVEDWEQCNGNTCATPCQPGQWSSWSQCPSCGQANRQRSRSIAVRATNGGAQCLPNDLAESESCNNVPCPLPCLMEQWSGWSQCSSDCGEGRRQRLRSVLVPAAFGGLSCGQAEEWEACNNGPCARDCDLGGQQCDFASLAESESCQIQPCPVNCQMAQWSAWSQCSSDCGEGRRQRLRSVQIPAAFGGLSCGPAEEWEACNNGPCSVDCVVSQWYQWPQCSACSADCGQGSRQRLRSVLTPASNGGKACPNVEDWAQCDNGSCRAPFVCNGVFGQRFIADGCTAEFVLCSGGVEHPKICPGPSKFDIASSTCKLPKDIAACAAPEPSIFSKIGSFISCDNTGPWGSEGIARKVRIIDTKYNASNNELIRAKRLVKNAIVEVEAVPFPARKVRIIDTKYNASNNELVRTKTLVKNAIVEVEAVPFRPWYETHYATPLGRKKGAKLTKEEDDVLNKKRGRSVQRKFDERKKNASAFPTLEDWTQCNNGPCKAPSVCDGVFGQRFIPDASPAEIVHWSWEQPLLHAQLQLDEDRRRFPRRSGTSMGSLAAWLASAAVFAALFAVGLLGLTGARKTTTTGEAEVRETAEVAVLRLRGGGGKGESSGGVFTATVQLAPVPDQATAKAVKDALRLEHLLRPKFLDQVSFEVGPPRAALLRLNAKPALDRLLSVQTLLGGVVTAVRVGTAPEGIQRHRDRLAARKYLRVHKGLKGRGEAAQLDLAAARAAPPPDWPAPNAPLVIGPMGERTVAAEVEALSAQRKEAQHLLRQLPLTAVDLAKREQWDAEVEELRLAEAEYRRAHGGWAGAVPALHIAADVAAKASLDRLKPLASRLLIQLQFHSAGAVPSGAEKEALLAMAEAGEVAEAGPGPSAAGVIVLGHDETRRVTEEAEETVAQLVAPPGLPAPAIVLAPAIPAPVPVPPAPLAPAPAPALQAPVPAPQAPIPAPQAPVPAPQAPVPAPPAPVPVPPAPIPAPAQPAAALDPVAQRFQDGDGSSMDVGSEEEGDGSAMDLGTEEEEEDAAAAQRQQARAALQARRLRDRAALQARLRDRARRSHSGLRSPVIDQDEVAAELRRRRRLASEPPQ